VVEGISVDLRSDSLGMLIGIAVDKDVVAGEADGVGSLEDGEVAVIVTRIPHR
jgi:hypothetical protein